jgi:DNA processing protein
MRLHLKALSPWEASPSVYLKRHRRLLSQGKQEALRQSLAAWRHPQRVPLGTHPAPENFPVRNRIVAGMPLGAIIVEGAQYSGWLITARLAIEFGRELFGVPRNVTQAVSVAPNLLITQGTKLVTNAEDVIEKLPAPVRAALTKAEPPESQQRNLLVAASLTGRGQKVYALLSSAESRPIDDIAENTGLNSSDVLATLFDLEMQGFVPQLPGKLFSKVLL